MYVMVWYGLVWYRMVWYGMVCNVMSCNVRPRQTEKCDVPKTGHSWVQDVIDSRNY